MEKFFNETETSKGFCVRRIMKEGELKNFVEVWILVITSLSYSYYVASKIPKGFLRLIFLLPVISLFLFLPFNLSPHQLYAESSIFISWYANFKLLLFSFDHGPLFPTPPKLLHFVAIASLPIKIKQFSPTPTNKSNSQVQIYIISLVKLFLLGIRAVIIAFIYDHAQNQYKQHYLGKYFVFSLFSLMYSCGLEFNYAIYQIPGILIFGLDQLDPQFNNPLLATSLQDFWGRRWNLISSNVLRLAVYNPLRHVSTHLVGRRWACLPAILATFLVSGLMHEVMYYNQSHLPPTWEVTIYFVIHGICVDFEIVMKKKKITVGEKWWWRRLVLWPLVLGFLVATNSWLSFRPLLRNGIDEMALTEYTKVVNFVKGLMPC